MPDPQDDWVDRASLGGTLHVYVAFDWGDEIDLEKAQTLVPAEVRDLPRRRRTPPSIGYRPPPLRFALSAPHLELAEQGVVGATAEATVFDFAAVSVALHIPFRMSPAALGRFAAQLADSKPWVQAAQQASQPLHDKLLPAIQSPAWRDDMNEEYFVFHLPPSDFLQADEVRASCGAWLAGLVRLENEPLSAEEVAEACRVHLSYYPADLFVADWAAAFLLDKECEETLQTIEFANLQLLEYRHIDQRLEESLAVAYKQVHLAARAKFPFWRASHRPLNRLGELKVEANGLFERTANVLKLVGDQYLARVYRHLGARFHLREWERSIQRKLEVAEGIYEVLSDQAITWRTEFLEVVVIILILLEVVLALVRP